MKVSFQKYILMVPVHSHLHKAEVTYLVLQLNVRHMETRTYCSEKVTVQGAARRNRMSFDNVERLNTCLLLTDEWKQIYCITISRIPCCPRPSLSAFTKPQFVTCLLISHQEWVGLCSLLRHKVRNTCYSCTVSVIIPHRGRIGTRHHTVTIHASCCCSTHETIAGFLDHY